MDKLAAGMNSWKVEVIADSTGTWSSNGIRLATQAEAEEYGCDLMGRWMLVREMRVVQSPDPVNYTYVKRELQSV